MNREQMIEKLVDDDIDTILSSPQSIDYLVNILRDGIGYNKQTDLEIQTEYEQRTWEDE